MDERRDHVLVAAIAALISVNAFLYFLWRDQTYVHIDAIAHVNKARGLFDNFEPGLRQLGTVWLPLPHILMAPLAAIDPLWRSGAAGSIVSIFSFIGTGVFLFLTGYIWTGSRITAWLAFLLFALNPHLIYLFTTPENEPLMILCASGLLYYLVLWTRDEDWRSFAMAALFVFAGTWTRYEGWALAAAVAVLIPFIARKHRLASTILFTGAASAGPMLWMLYNMVYFDDPLMFGYGIGSAQNYATVQFPSAGKWWYSTWTYFMDTAYCLNSGVLWIGVAGLILSLVFISRRYWQPTMVLITGCFAMFGFYVLNLYSNMVPVALPGMFKNDPQSVMNVRYGSVMASTIPLFGALFVFIVWQHIERHRAFSLFLLTPFLMPDVTPAASREPVDQQFTQNLFYTEAVHNQSFWMPPFVDAARRLKADIDAGHDETSLILTNTRIVHVVVWATGIPMRRFVTEMDEDVWGPSLSHIDPRVRWAITEEGDQLWNGQGKFLSKNFVEVLASKTANTATVHLYRRP